MIDKIKINRNKKVAATTIAFLLGFFSISMLILMATCADSWPSVNQSAFTEIHPPKNDTPYHKDSLSILGPESGYVGEEYVCCLSIGANDCEYEGSIDWGDKSHTDVAANVIEEKYGVPDCQLCASHAWKMEGTYWIFAMARKKLNDKLIGFGPILDASQEVTIKKNNPPIKPNRITGYALVRAGQTFSYSAVTTDPENHKVTYRFKWGDGTPDTITDLVDSGTVKSVDHTWEKEGIWEAKVQAIDSLKAESEWSDKIRVTVK
jgi:hypothetical protein